ncbi:Hsp20/alpha crystallin family protein [Bacteroidetes/Chlorobi group bacterium MS-B_bin-24]|jgi:HSP20 family protein|nr:MAG: Hsp20/alpha crystallin family protein [Bacteroidetes/Chlorobi group bacterium MS-B_bin-24]
MEDKMKMRRFNPMWEMENMLRNISNLIDSTIEKDVDISAEFTPIVDIWEDDVNVYFEFELPGVKKEDIKITINDDKVLIVSGEKRIDPNIDNKTCCRSERIYGHFHRAFQLPDDLNTSKVKAQFENGVLTISIAKSEVKTPKERLVEVK